MNHKREPILYKHVSMTQKKRRLQKHHNQEELKKLYVCFNDSKEEETTETYTIISRFEHKIMFQ